MAGPRISERYKYMTLPQAAQQLGIHPAKLRHLQHGQSKFEMVLHGKTQNWARAGLVEDVLGIPVSRKRAASKRSILKKLYCGLSGDTSLTATTILVLNFFQANYVPCMGILAMLNMFYSLPSRDNYLIINLS